MPTFIQRVFFFILTASLTPVVASADAPQHLIGVWEGLVTAESDGRIYREYVAFEFLADGRLTMANAREPNVLNGTWVKEAGALSLTIAGRPGAKLDQIVVGPKRLTGRLGYGQGKAVSVDLHRVEDRKSIPPLAPGTKVSAGLVNVDGYKLGESALALHSRRRYAAPCDADQLPKHKLIVFAYGAQPCRGRQFEDGTSVIIFTDLDTKDPKNQSIRTVAWLGGQYFHTRTNFPLKIGHRVRGKKGRKQMADRLKQSIVRTMQLKRQPRLTVTTLSGAIHLIDDGRHLIGVVLGPMPQTTKNDLWSGVLQVWEKYTQVRKQ